MKDEEIMNSGNEVLVKYMKTPVSTRNDIAPELPAARIAP
jgi:hypothetical protein